VRFRTHLVGASVSLALVCCSSGCSSRANLIAVYPAPATELAHASPSTARPGEYIAIPVFTSMQPCVDIGVLYSADKKKVIAFIAGEGSSPGDGTVPAITACGRIGVKAAKLRIPAVPTGKYVLCDLWDIGSAPDPRSCARVTITA
jgi:hypothetical protein